MNKSKNTLHRKVLKKWRLPQRKLRKGGIGGGISDFRCHSIIFRGKLYICGTSNNKVFIPWQYLNKLMTRNQIKFLSKNRDFFGDFGCDAGMMQHLSNHVEMEVWAASYVVNKMKDATISKISKEGLKLGFKHVVFFKNGKYRFTNDPYDYCGKKSIHFRGASYSLPIRRRRQFK